MSLADLLAELQRRDIRLRADGEQLHCDAPAGALTPEMRDELRRRKNEVLEFLRSAQALASQQRAIVPMRHGGRGTAVFAVAGHNGDVFCYRSLVQHLPDRPFFGLEPPGLDGNGAPLAQVEDLAAYFAAQIRAFQPEGPYVVAGYCAGGTVAFELGRQLLEAGEPVSLVALFGSPYPSWYCFPAYHAQRCVRRLGRIGGHVRELALRSPQERRRYLHEHLDARKARHESQAAATADPVLMRRTAVERATLAAVRNYRPGRFAGRLGLFLPCLDWQLIGGAERRWRALAQRTDEYFGPAGCDGENMLRPPYAPAMANLFRRGLDEAEA